MTIRNSNRVLFCTVALGVLGAASTAMAADPATDAQGSSVQEVVVTATRRVEQLEKVPASVTVVDPKALQGASVTNFMQLSTLAVGVSTSMSGSVPGVAIRGVTSTISGYSVESNVAVYVDGFYNPQQITMANDLANIAGIQVLKGPQGTLYGRNATGGAVLINTLGPSKVWTGNFDASYGSFNERIFNGYIAGPINDRVRFSLTGHYDAGDSYARLVIPPADFIDRGPATKYVYYEARGKLQADITDNLQATLGLNIGYQNDPRGNMYSTFYYSPLPGSIAATRYGTEVNVGNIPNGAYTYQATLKLDYKTPIGDLTSYTGWARRKTFDLARFDATILDSLAFSSTYLQDTFQQSVVYNINAIKNVDLTVGGEYYTDNFRTDPDFFYIIGGAQNLSKYQKQWTTSWAIYVLGTYHVTPQLSLEAGVRYTDDRIRTSWLYSIGAVGAPGSFTLDPLTYFHAGWTAATPQASIRYELAPRTDVYFTYAQGYRAGNFDPGGPAPIVGFLPGGFPAVNPETIDSYEVGFKTNQERFRFESAFFYYQYSNLQVSGTKIVSGNLTSFLENAKSATIYGWDNELHLNLTDRLHAHANVEWLHARYGDFSGASGQGVDPTNSFVVQGLQNLSGAQMVRAPDYSGNIGADYTQPIPYGSLFFTTNLYFTGSFPFSDPSLFGPTDIGGTPDVIVQAPAGLSGKQHYLQKAYVLLSAQVTWTDPSKHWNVSVYGNNLTNTRYRLTYHGSALFGDFSVPADPITCGIRAGYKF